MKQNKPRRARADGVQHFLVMEERYDDGGVFKCQWPEDSLEEYVHIIMRIRELAADRNITPHEAFLLVMHAKFGLPQTEWVHEHTCPDDCADWMAGRPGARDLFIPHQCPPSWDLIVSPA
ncbi:hypothetical protein PUR71_08865 [Streptomyces sp. SP17BM10]|uniref:hypothetical protein n=1 Tax=Streptomyces sp. SP17BM10 TaxID=3002530 RepID=UPI002E76693E|nr:hypothetical protein [Streptomyces sp. SP17BM10]MEE1783025.1 hypothetical protein [Streptomyces sp. SP17BM10]